MTAHGGSWRALVRELGGAVLDLLRAEADALVRDLGASGRTLVRALVFAAVAGAVAFWTLGLLVYLAVELLTLVLPRWGAAAVVLGAFALAAAALALAARSRLRALESPDVTVRRRLADSRRWWRERIEADPEAGTAAPPEIEEELP
ncbi:MAG: hypothetical protein F9K18_13740 [Thermoanaerobaculia bacterium]|nr:MAG: hypothetical protein F9K18_13740 [Thermoanaerobaculia bacterium]